MFVLTFVSGCFISPVFVMCLINNALLVRGTFPLHLTIRSGNENEVMVVLKGNSRTPKRGHFVYCIYIIPCEKFTTELTGLNLLIDRSIDTQGQKID